MLLTVILLTITCGVVKSSDFHPVAPIGAAPVVTAASSQYFVRTFNRLVAAPLQPVVPIAPAVPVSPPIAVAPAPQPVLPVLTLPSARPVVIDAKRTTVIPVNPTNATPPQNLDPNVAIAIATAQAAAPVATILLPPYPFGLPPSFGFVPQSSQIPQPQQFPQVPENSNNRESTTRKATTRVTTTNVEQESTTALPSNIDNSFAQALPSNENINFKQYLAPLPNPRPASQLPRPAPQPVRPAPQLPRPQKVKTNVEVVPVPLAYIAPPAVDLRHHQHHHHHHHQALKVVPHVHTYIPKTRIIIRPVHSHLSLRTLAIPARSLHATYGPPKSRKVVKRYPQNIILQSRDTEPTTFRPLNRPFTKPPRI